jgi:sigma-E factor negative regulatory protein RseA
MDEMKPEGSSEVLKRRQCLSALADGEARGDEVSQACAAWREDAQARADWHVYALVGDVLRSDDLARSTEPDTAFLMRLRERMAREPVVLAPAAMASPAPGVPVAAMPARKRPWGAPMAMAAGALAVIGVAAVMRGVALPDAQPTLAAAPVQGAVPVATGPVRQVEALVANGAAAPVGDVAASAFVRDPEIDRYRSEERRVGKECRRLCRSRWSPYH